MSVRGCDLSAVQGVLPDSVWKALADRGIKFAFLRAVIGNESWTDGCANSNMVRARSHGILVAPYVFLYPLPHLNAAQQAENFVRKLEGLGMMSDELPPMLDAEWPPREEKAKDGTIVYPWKRWGCTAEQIRSFTLACVTRCEELTGVEWPLYSYRYWLKCIEAEKEPGLALRPLVLANYTLAGRWPTDAELSRLTVPKPWDRISFVQHDGNGGLKLPNGGDADFDVFLGSEDELRALAAKQGSQLDVLPEDHVIDIVMARQQMRGAIVDDAVAQYRRDRIDESLAIA